MDTSLGRLLTLLELLQAYRRLTAREISDRLQVDVRTVRRYVAGLQEMGIPVEGERGPAGGYRRFLIEEVFGLLGGFNLSWLTTLEKFFIGQNATALGLSFGQAVQAARGGGPVVSSTPLVGAGQAVLVLAAYGLAFIAGSMLVVRRGDIT